MGTSSSPPPERRLLIHGRPPGPPCSPAAEPCVFPAEPGPGLLPRGRGSPVPARPPPAPQVAQGWEEPRPAPRGRSQRQPQAGARGAGAGSRARAPRGPAGVGGEICHTSAGRWQPSWTRLLLLITWMLLITLSANLFTVAERSLTTTFCFSRSRDT
ncbi:ly6/PLAUR domain-containing protein 6B isoform X2 [Saimiri boliviensis]|uniref:ly6/PLAUR domain-containing protein 6B isoform X2 n=1 Tax=Saimiri boliviensis TaxID=27679 RepID=UPI003D779C7C